MIGMIAAVAFLASVDDQLALTPVPLGGQEQRLDGATWSGSAAGMGAVGLVGGDAVMLLAGATLLGVTSRSCEAGGLACVNGGAVVLALAGLAVLPPVFALLLGEKANRTGVDRRAGLLTVAAQVAAIGLAAGGLASPAGPWRAGLLVSAAAVHFVGIPLAVGLVPARPTPGAAGGGVTPTLSLALHW